MDVFNWIWKFFVNTILISIFIGIMIGQYIAVQGHVGLGKWVDHQVLKIEYFIKTDIPYDKTHKNP